MYYIIGLGNPGEEYKNTRHNVGRIILEATAETFNLSSWVKNKGANALFTKGELWDKAVELLLPETFMNNSGQAVSYLKQKHDAVPSEIIVIYDDVDLALGEIKVSVGRGDGGHNGVSSIIKTLGSKDFIRIRIGISPTSFWTKKTKRPTGEYMAKYVLGKFNRGEREKLEGVKERVVGALHTIISDGVAKAMNEFN